MAETKMTPESARLPAEIAHVLFMDLVGYSRLSIEEQTQCVLELSRLVRSTEEFRRAEAAGELICRDYGDGIALVFFRDPVAPAACAVELARKLAERPHLRLRMGIHSGPVVRVTDITGKENLTGGGMNRAQRVMECGDAGHILLSRASTDVISQFAEWSEAVRDLGVCEVKHGIRLHLFNLCLGAVGNPAAPQKLLPVAEAGEAAFLPARGASDRTAFRPTASAASTRRAAVCCALPPIHPPKQITPPNCSVRKT